MTVTQRTVSHNNSEYCKSMQHTQVTQHKQKPRSSMPAPLNSVHEVERTPFSYVWTTCHNQALNSSLTPLLPSSLLQLILSYTTASLLWNIKISPLLKSSPYFLKIPKTGQFIFETDIQFKRHTCRICLFVTLIILVLSCLAMTFILFRALPPLSNESLRTKNKQTCAA